MEEGNDALLQMNALLSTSHNQGINRSGSLESGGSTSSSTTTTTTNSSSSVGIGKRDHHHPHHYHHHQHSLSAVDCGDDAAVSALAASFEIRQMEPGILRLKEKFYHAANIFVVLGRDMDLIVDSGVGVWDLFAFLQLHIPGFGMRKPVLAVATNVHFDHSGGLHDLREMGCQVAIHELEAPALASGDNYATCSCFRWERRR